MSRAATSSPPPIPGLNERFGPYEILERIGVGGMATVHRAIERGIEGVERDVALKRLLPHLAESEQFIRSFVHEARLASRLTHPHIVQMYELGRVNTTYFISMEYIEGRDLRQVLRRTRLVGPPPIEVTLAILDQVCDALDYAHTRTAANGAPLDLVHRDVSPSNIIVSDTGHVKVIDFGIAKAANQQFKTQTGRIKGKMAYLSPEAVTGGALDRRSDLFSAGVIAHELLCARPLFATKSDYQTLLRVQNAPVVAPSEVNPECPRELDKIVLRALTRDRNLRWQSSRQIRAAIDRMRDWYHLHADEKAVRKWMDWAFSEDRSDPWAGASPSTSRDREPPTLEEDDEVLELVWQGRSKLTQSAVILDDVPDFSEHVETTPPARTPRRRATTMAPVWAVATLDYLDDDVVVADRTPAVIPTTQDAVAVPAVADKRIGRWSIAAVGGATLLAAAAAAFLMLRGSSEPPPADPRATLRFEVEPAGATVRIDERAPSTGSRETMVAPGDHYIAVHHPDYNPWGSAISLTDGETQTIRVVLERRPEDVANITVKSAPDGLPLLVDGEASGKTTPATVQLSPGHHVLSVAVGPQPLWEHEFEAAADTNYEFQPTISKARIRRHRRRAAGLTERPASVDTTSTTVTTEPPSALGSDDVPTPVELDPAGERPATEELEPPVVPSPGPRRTLPVL